MADFRTETADDDAPRIYEPRSERMRRRFSLIVINILGFISCLGFSIVLTSAFPYLVQMDPSADKKFLGWVIAANPLGQLISSPLVGYLANRWKSVRFLCIATGVLNVVGFALYASVGALPQPRKYWIILARFIVGVAAGSVTLCIMYISRATTIAERTSFISMNAFVQTVGFILGPVIQSSLISLGEEGYRFGYADWGLNMYTVAAWISCGLSMIGILLFTPCVFQEFDLGEREAEWKQIRASESAKLTASHEETQNGPCQRPNARSKRDSIGMALCIANFFIVGFIFILIETLATPLVIDQLGYSDEEAVEKVGIVFSAGCALTAVSFACSGPLAKRITERRVLVFCGLLPLIISYIVVLPYSGPTPPMRLDSSVGNETSYWNLADFPLQLESTNSSEDLVDPFINGTSRGGCPRVQEWCLYTPAVKPIPLIAGFMITAIGYAFASTMSTSSLTQVLAPGEQGTWMGIYLAGGSLSRILGPIYLSYVYTIFGTWMTFGSIIAILILTFTVNLCLFKHLIPLVRRDTTMKAACVL